MAPIVSPLMLLALSIITFLMTAPSAYAMKGSDTLKLLSILPSIVPLKGAFFVPIEPEAVKLFDNKYLPPMTLISSELFTTCGTWVIVKACAMLSAPSFAGFASVVNDCITLVLSKRGIRRILPWPSVTTMNVALVIFIFV